MFQENSLHITPYVLDTAFLLGLSPGHMNKIEFITILISEYVFEAL